MKTLKTLFLALLLTLLPCAAGLCAKSPDVVPISGSHALLVRCGGQTLLIGGENEQAVESALAGGVQGVVRLCDHAEHSAAVDALAAHYGVPVYTPGSALPVSGASWQGQSLVMDVAGTPYVFGSDSAQANAVTYRCDGAPFPYPAQTNEAAVNIRKDTTTKSAKVGQLKRGDLLSVTGTVQNAAGEYWYGVALSDGTTGYIRSDLVTPAAGAAAVSAAAVETVSGFVQEPMTAAASQEQPSEGSGTKYIGNKKTKVFHYPTCHTLPAAKNQVYADSRDYFISKGYRPCKNCNP